MFRIAPLALGFCLLAGCNSKIQPPSSANKLAQPLEPTNQVATPTVPNAPKVQTRKLPNHWSDELQHAVDYRLSRHKPALTAQQEEALIGKVDAVVTRAEPFSRERNLLNQDVDWVFVLAAFESTQGVADLLVQGGQDRQVLLSVLSLQGSPAGRAQCVEAWLSHRQEIRELWNQGFYGAESLFMFQRSTSHADADREYDGWLSDLFLTQGSGLDLVQRVYLVIRHGATIRGLLWRNEEGFRSRFRRELWPVMARVFRESECPISLYMEQPETVWKIASTPNGEELLRRFGMIPCVLFHGKHRYPADLQPEVERLLLSGYATAVDAVCNDRLRRDYQFHQFLREKPLQPIERSVAFQELLSAGEQYPKLLSQYLSMSVADLDQRFKPKTDLELWDDSLPSYLKVSKRWLLGQEFDPGDTRHVLTDMAVHGTSIAVGLGVMYFGGDPFSSGGTAGEVVRNGLSVVQDAMHESVDADVAAELERLGQQRSQTFQKISDMTVMSNEAVLKESMEEVATLSTVADLNVLKHRNPKVLDIVSVFHGCNPICRESVSLVKDRRLYFRMGPSLRLTLSWQPLPSRGELKTADANSLMKETQLGIPHEAVDWWIGFLMAS